MSDIHVSTIDVNEILVVVPDNHYIANNISYHLELNFTVTPGDVLILRFKDPAIQKDSAQILKELGVTLYDRH